jgi:inorganic pyrophosphatase
MNIWHDISESRVLPGRFVAVIEIPKGGKQKYEMDKETGMLRLDRILYTSTHYPANYGFIPLTVADDGDPLDVLVLCSEALNPMCLVECYPIGVFSMTDENELDEKIIAIPFEDPQMNEWKDIDDLPKHVFTEIQHFFSVYKSLEHRATSLSDVDNALAAQKVIEKSLAAYRHQFNIKD